MTIPMIASDIISTIERLAPPILQEDYDNSGIQVGDPSSEVKAVLLCLDITENVVREAVRRGCQMIVSHHPLIFRGLKHITPATYQERCVVEAVKSGIVIYSAHTSLDNAPGGVNYKMAEVIGLENLDWLEPKGDAGGSGLIGELPTAEDAESFLSRLRFAFGSDAMMYSDPSGRLVHRVALCGGAGSFLIGRAEAAGADCFVTGEISYHQFFDRDSAGSALVVALGHYQSEKFTVDLLGDCLAKDCPELVVYKTEINTNPIHYSCQINPR